MSETKKTAGRPPREGGAIKAYPIRIEDEIIDKLDKIADIEKKKTGYNLNRSDIIRRALSEFIQRYDDNN